jgi:hypothetical protein
MNLQKALNPAEIAGKQTLLAVYDCLDKRKSFRLEAGAGAGKTHSLIKALDYLIEHQAAELLRRKPAGSLHFLYQRCSRRDQVSNRWASGSPCIYHPCLCMVTHEGFSSFSEEMDRE